MKPIIEDITAREILDSRGNPTVEATVVLDRGQFGAPSALEVSAVGDTVAWPFRVTTVPTGLV